MLLYTSAECVLNVSSMYITLYSIIYHTYYAGVGSSEHFINDTFSFIVGQITGIEGYLFLSYSTCYTVSAIINLKLSLLQVVASQQP